jgi:nicotinamidase-related amidase
VAWTIDDLLTDEETRERLAPRTYLLEDCSSPVVVPEIIDYTDEANAAYERYARAGMHVVRSTDPIRRWPGPAGVLPPTLSGRGP